MTVRYAHTNIVAADWRGLAAFYRRGFGEVVSREVAAVGTITFVYATDPEGNVLEVQRWA